MPPLLRPTDCVCGHPLLQHEHFTYLDYCGEAGCWCGAYVSTRSEHVQAVALMAGLVAVLLIAALIGAGHWL